MPTIRLELSYEQGKLLEQICEIEAAWEGIYEPHEHVMLVAIKLQLQEKLNKLAKKVYSKCRK